MASSSQPRPQLSVLEGIALMVGIVVGIGIFRMPSLVAGNVDSERIFMLAWLLGGAITLIGALCYAELASTHPSASGEHHFLEKAYGPTLALFFAWARAAVIQTGAIAMVGFVYGDYAQMILPLGPYGVEIHAALAVIAFTALNIWGTPQSKRSQVVFTALALAGLAGVIIAGFLAGGAAPNGAGAPVSPSEGAFGMAMVLVLLTYGGWNEAAYLSGEMRDVQRNMVRVLLGGTAVIVLAYACVNLAYLNVLGLEGLRQSSGPAADIMARVAGDAGGLIVAVMVCVIALSTINGTIFTGARTYHALHELPALRTLSLWSERGGTPRNALLLQGAIALALVFFGAMAKSGLSAMVDYTAPVFWFFMMLVSVSLIILRVKEPGREPVFRVPLYPVLPLLFTLLCAGLVYSSVVYAGWGALAGIGMVLMGGVLLLFRRERSAMPAE